MKAIKSLVVAALAAAGMAATADVQAEKHGGGVRVHGGGQHGGGHHGGGGRVHGGGHWHGHRHGGHWSGRYWYPRIGFYVGAPLAWSAWYWGSPYYYHPRTVVYDRVIERYPASYPDGVMEPSTTQVPRAEGAPTQGPAYMNYCESSKAYYPKVASCPEGWKFIPSR